MYIHIIILFSIFVVCVSTFVFPAILCKADIIQLDGSSQSTMLTKHEVITNECYNSARLSDGSQSELITCTTRGYQGILLRALSSCERMFISKLHWHMAIII